jgi:hypothetical protein
MHRQAIAGESVLIPVVRSTIVSAKTLSNDLLNLVTHEYS